MHDKPTQVHWHEPKAGENAGYGKFKRQPMPYDRFMESEGVPVYRGIGVRRVQDLPLRPGRASEAAEATSSSSAPKGSGAAMWSKSRVPAR